MSVLEIQQALAAAGFDPGPLDGKMGPKTRAAISAYQTAKGLKVDGIAGPETQGSLRGSGGAAAGGAAAPDQKQTLQSKYPQFAWAFDDPEVAKVLNDAVAGKWGADEVQGAIQATNWWKSKSDAERNWLQVLGTNPGEARQRMFDYDSITKYLALANDYGLPMSFETATRDVQGVVTGAYSGSELQERLRIQAKALYPQLAQQIDAGSTITDIYAPYKNMAADLLGLNPADIKLTDPKWQIPLQFTDKSGQKRLATTDEWQTMLRSNAAFGYDTSANGRKEAAQFETQLLQMFGNVA